MNATLVWQRILWKEARHLGLLAVAIVVLCTGLPVLAGAAAADGATTTQLLWGLATFVPGCYAFGCAAMLLSGEKEMGTWGWLRNSGVSQVQTLIAKAAFVLVSAYAVQVALYLFWAISQALHPVTWPHWQNDDPWAIGPLITLEFAAAGWLACILVSRIIPATLTWLGLLIFGLAVISALVYPQGDILPIRLVLLLLVLVADVAVSRLWWRSEHPLLELPGLADLQWPRWLSRRRTGIAARPERYLFAEQRTAQRLNWKTRRQLLGVPAIIGGALALSLFLAALTQTWSTSSIPWGLCSVPFILGLLVFRDEQTQARFRFYADRGISPRWLWWTAQRHWLLFALLTSLAIAAAVFWNIPRPHVGGLRVESEHELFRHLRLTTAGMLLVSYAVGQWASQVFRTTFFALIGGVLLLIPCVAWCGLSIPLNIPLWLQAIPLTLWLLAITWWRMPAWCLEESDWMTRGKLGLAMVVPPTLLFLVTCGYRAVEFITPGYLGESQRIMATAPNDAAAVDPVSQQLNNLIADADLVFRSSGIATDEQADDLALAQQPLIERFYRDLLPGILESGTAGQPQVVVKRLPASLLQLLRYDLDRRLRSGDDPPRQLQDRVNLLAACRRLTAAARGTENATNIALHFVTLLPNLPASLDSPAVTVEEARSALDAAALTLAEFPLPSEREADYYRQHAELKRKAVETDEPPESPEEWLARVARRLPSERMRAECLIFSEYVHSHLDWPALRPPAGSFREAARRAAAVSYDQLVQYERQAHFERLSAPALYDIAPPSAMTAYLLIERFDNARGYLLSAACVLFRKVHQRLPVDHAELTAFWKPDPRLELEPGLEQPFQYFRQGLGLGAPAWATQLDKVQMPWAQQPLWYVETRHSRMNAAAAARNPAHYRNTNRYYGEFFPIPPKIEPDAPPADAGQVENPPLLDMGAGLPGFGLPQAVSDPP